VFENRVLRRFGPKRDELHNFYCSSSTIKMNNLRRIKWAEHVARMGKKRNVYRLLAGMPAGKRPLGRPRCM
jgi:hypothetical protein